MTTTAIDQDRDRTAPPRAPVRVMQVIAALANHRDGLSLAQLSDVLQRPRPAHLPRALEGGYVMSENPPSPGAGNVQPGCADPEDRRFSGNVRSWLNEQPGLPETVLVGVPSKD